MGLIAIISGLSAIRLYRVMRSKERAAKAKVEHTQQDLEVTRQALAQASQVRASLLANFRQDFRTPLTAVLEIARLLQTTSLSGAQVEYVNAIRETTHNLMGSIGNVTDFASLEAGALQLQQREFDLMAIIDAALLNVYEQMGEHHAELSVQVDVDVPRALVGDAVRIRQVLQNLLHNAMKFTQSGDVLLHVSRVSEQSKSATVAFAVIDTGVGMDKNFLKTAFEPYAMHTRCKEEGCGLGLPLSKMLVERMGGAIAAQSSPGKGTQVSFSLPLQKQNHVLALRDEDVRQIRGKRVLLIGGRELSRQILQYYLHAWDAVVSYSPRFEDAVELMKQDARYGRRFDLVLAPAFVAERNAVELVATVRDHPKFDGVPFLIIASRQECEALPQLEQLAGVLLLPRPVRRGDLVIKLSDALRMEIPDRLWKDLTDYDPEEIHKLDFEFSDASLRRGSVLVADSNTIHQKAVCMMLERMGYEAQSTISGTEALELLKKHPFDLVLLDTRLAVMDGFGVASALRDLEQKPVRTPMVGMLSVAREGERERCLLAGMDDCLLKPLDMETIARTLRRWIRKPNRPSTGRDSVEMRHGKLA